MTPSKTLTTVIGLVLSGEKIAEWCGENTNLILACSLVTVFLFVSRSIVLANQKKP
ncbi:hypothetical protein DYBT9275_00938 [Dyadobacter sp. CECT 9275]|uniref:Uncharacterized protein n=1 Tax=Dyadobacter helix TaxID=2822344 RepID=A0A916N4L6_9BACT|nr:hypothetical protein [Dyadobacter sp. CECT 9275]CAG4992316.1 hypothetical protein DYBT9275_00938 [Dyadobacter sp. CECT 9275]